MGPALRAALLKAKEGRRCDHVIEHGGARLVTVKNGFFNAVKRAGLAWQVPHPTKKGETTWKTDVTPHVIRHTVLTWLEQGKVDPRRAQQLAGHKDLATTSLYQHPDAEMLTEAVELLEERLLAKPEITSDPARDVEGG
jgi:integrase